MIDISILFFGVQRKPVAKEEEMVYYYKNSQV